MQFTWVDLFIVAVFFYFAVKGWMHGIVYFLVTFLAFAISSLFALKYASLLSLSLSSLFKINTQWSTLAAYFLIAITIQVLISFIVSRLFSNNKKIGKLNQIIGAFVSATSGLFLVALFFFVILLIPVRGVIKEDIRRSRIAPKVLAIIKNYGGPLPGLLQDSAQEITKFLTISPNTDQAITLNVFVKPQELLTDETTEAAMLSMVNLEREKNSLPPLSTSYALKELARSYSHQIFLTKHFSHIDQQGKNASDRLKDAKIRYLIAGENLAYAVDLTQAHSGLMNSEGHRKNILDPSFKKIGIGIVDGGIWGKVFTQVFTD